MSVDLAGDMATWIAETPHDRPFFRDRGFIARFGHPGRGLLRQAVDELRRRAEAKAAALGAPVAWPTMPLVVDGNPILFNGQQILVPETPRA